MIASIPRAAASVPSAPRTNGTLADTRAEMIALTLSWCWMADKSSWYDPTLFIASSSKTMVSPPSAQTTLEYTLAVALATNDDAVIFLRVVAWGKPSIVRSPAVPKSHTDSGFLGGARSFARSWGDSWKSIFTRMPF